MPESEYNKHMERRDQYLSSELGRKRNIFLKINGWKVLAPKSNSSKQPDPDLCISYRYRDNDDNVKIKIYGNGAIKEFINKKLSTTYKDWEDFIDKYRWPRKDGVYGDDGDNS